MSLEEKLTSLRKEKGLTQLELAEMLDVSRQAISRWEVGTALPSIENLRTLSKLYGVSIDYLLNDQETEASNQVEAAQPKPAAQDDSKKEPKYIMPIICIAVILILAAVILTVSGQNQEQTQDDPLPMDGMTFEATYDKPSVIFDFE